MTLKRQMPFRTLAGGGLALAAAMGIGRFAYTPILPAMQRAADLSTAKAGVLASANYAGYLVGALLVATVPPGVARRRTIMGCLIAVAMTTGSMAATRDIVAWGVVRFLAGVASAGVFVLASGSVLDALRREGRASLSGWPFAGVGFGIAASGLVVRGGAGMLGWRGDWLALALVAAAVVYPCWRWLPHTYREAAPEGMGPLQGSVPRLALTLLFTAYFLEGAGYIVTGTFLVAIVERTPGLRGAGTGVWIVVGLAGALSAVLWAMLAARIGYARALVLAYVAQACGILLPIFGGLGAAVTTAFLFGGTFLGISVLTLTHAGRLIPYGSAQIIGLLTAAYGVGQIVGPVVAGNLAGGTRGFDPALIVASATVFVGGVLLALFQRFDPSHR